MSMKIDITPENALLTIGDDFANRNTIAFTITLTGDEFVLLRLQIPVGVDAVLHQDVDANNIEVETPGQDPAYAPKEVRDNVPPNTMVWSLGNSKSGVEVKGSTTLSVSISKILCRASVGDSNIEVMGKGKAKAGTSRTQCTATLKVTKAKPTTYENPILYFIAEPNFLISGERLADGKGKEVMLRWEVADSSGPVSLSFMGGPISTDSKGDPIKSGMTHKTPETGNYTLKLGGYRRVENVDVLSEKNWHEPQLRLRSSALKEIFDKETAFPTVIFDAGNKATDALYAIFMLLSKRDNQTVRTPVLCKSANGINGWALCDPESVPRDMASSPGVRLGDRLYLIGGSSVDWDQKSKTIRYYDLSRSDRGWQDATVTFSDTTGKDAEFEERMGHACVIVGDKIWVMGGSGQYGSLNDVWELTIDDNSNPITIKAQRIEDAVLSNPNWDTKWAPRCMFSAVHYQYQIWVCGGVDSPQGSALGGIYYRDLRSKDKVWKLRPEINETKVVKDASGIGVTRCGGELFTVITNSTALATDISGTVIHELASSTSTKDNWTTIDNKPHRPARWTDSNHSITLVAFNNRLYLRYLHRDALRWDLATLKKKGLGQLQVYIP